jgi:hypothetical protein
MTRIMRRRKLRRSEVAVNALYTRVFVMVQLELIHTAQNKVSTWVETQAERRGIFAIGPGILCFYPSRNFVLHGV